MTTFRGVVLPEHCDNAGYVTAEPYMGRVSDAIPNLIALTRGEDRSTGAVGGAALEYRFVYPHARARGRFARHQKRPQRRRRQGLFLVPLAVRRRDRRLPGDRRSRRDRDGFAEAQGHRHSARHARQS